MPVAFWGGEHICSKLVEIRVFRGCDIMCSASDLREGVWSVCHMGLAVSEGSVSRNG